MKKLILTATVALAFAIGTASAADLTARPYTKAPVAPAFSWTGFYIGVHGGGDWFDKNWTSSNTALNNAAGGCGLPCPAFAGSHTGSSWLAGGQIGFNYQAGVWVFGVEADASATDLKASSPHVLAPAFFILNSKTEALATVAGRVGIAYNQALFYVKGGGAWADDRFYTTDPAAIPAGTPLQLTNSTRWGWMVGAGVEYAFANNWSVKAEYNHLDFGTRTETLSAQPGCGCLSFQFDIRQTVDLVKVGLNYRFGLADPVVAKY